VPELEPAVIERYGDERAVAGGRHVLDGGFGSGGEGACRGRSLRVGDVPQSDRAVARAGDEPVARHRDDGAERSSAVDEAGAGQVPQPQGAVVTYGGELVIGAEEPHGLHVLRVGKDVARLRGAHVPSPDGVVVATGGDQRAARAECDAVDGKVVPEQRFPGR